MIFSVSKNSKKNNSSKNNPTTESNEILNLDFNLIKSEAVKVLKKYKPDLIGLTKNSEILLHFISDTEIQELNKMYRQKDKPTDVLSWSFIDENLLPHEVAGEIYISTETAIKDATAKNIPLEDQYYFLIIHGLLHIFHYDHNTDAEEDEMNQVTKEILTNLVHSLDNLKNLI